MSKNSLPETGYLRLPQIIGQSEVTPEEAAANKQAAKRIRDENPIASHDPHKEKLQKALDQKLSRLGSRTPRPATPPIIPWSKSKLWDAVRKGEFPTPVHLGGCTCWRVEDIRAFIEKVV